MPPVPGSGFRGEGSCDVAAGDGMEVEDGDSTTGGNSETEVARAPSAQAQPGVSDSSYDGVANPEGHGCGGLTNAARRFAVVVARCLVEVKVAFHSHRGTVPYAHFGSVGEVDVLYSRAMAASSG